MTLDLNLLETSIHEVPEGRVVQEEVDRTRYDLRRKKGVFLQGRKGARKSSEYLGGEGVPFSS